MSDRDWGTEPLPDSRPLFFDHIPKTAGTSVRKFRADRYPAGSLIMAPNGARLSEFLRQAPPDAALCGHFTFLPGDDALLRHYFAATVLRDPVERIVSSYFYGRRIGRQGHPISDLALELPFDAWIDRMATEHPDAVFNTTARHFAALASRSGEVGSGDELAALAIDGIDRYDLVGITGHLADFLHTLALALGLGMPEDVPRENVTPPDPDRDALSAETCRRIEQLSQADLALCRHADRRAMETRLRIMRRAGRAQVASLSGSGSRDRTTPIAQHAPEPQRVEFGTRDARIMSVLVQDAADRAQPLTSGREVDIVVRGVCEVGIDDLTVGLAIHNAHGVLVHGTNSRLVSDQPHLPMPPGEFEARFRFVNRLGHGGYRVLVALHRGLDHTTGCYHWLDPAAEFGVHANAGAFFEGITDLAMTFSLTCEPKTRA